MLVTGCAGFIGSHLVARLLDGGTSVVGVDSFTDYYAKDIKKANISAFTGHPGFQLRRLDLSRDSLDGLLNGIESVYHLAGQPGVRASFGTGFMKYVRHNIEATQRLLEAAVEVPLQSFVYASSSSVYGDHPVQPTPEDTPTSPVSPYGMTKVAVEDLAGVYFRSHGVPVVGLRYFTAYGPAQRPDMAFSRFIAQLLAGHPITVYGDGSQVRDFTFVDDIVAGTLLAAVRGRPGAIYNIGGGHPVELRGALELMSKILDRPVEILQLPPAPGDVRSTGADCARAKEDLGFAAAVTLEQGLRLQAQAARRHTRKAKRRARRWYLDSASG